VGATGGTAAKNLLELVPLNNDVSGWTVDPDNARTSGVRALTADSELGTELLIDGGAADLFMAPYKPKEFAYQNFVNATLRSAPDGAHVKLYILLMPSVEEAKGLYKGLLQASNYARKTGTPEDWQAPSPLVGDESRFQDTGSQWWVNFRKDVFYCEVSLDPSAGPAPDYTPGNNETKTEAIRFAQAIASGM
jgi:hypothetical protein